MDLLLPRRKTPPGAPTTLGDLFINDVHECVTLEDQVREIPGVPVKEWKVDKKTAIPAGRYPVTWDYSNHFGREMLHVNNVEGFLGIRIHSVGTAADTDGCIGVGDQVISPNQIGGGIRHQVLEKLEAKVCAALEAGEKVWLTVQNAA